jgi:glucose/arabinose dehydrogenase
MLVWIAAASAATAATLPPGFTETLMAGGLSNPTAMALAPDGRIFVCQQGGQIRVIKAGELLATPFLSVTVNSAGERGLLGVAFDPNFAVNQFVYAYYTADAPTPHNRVSRFTANGDVAAAGSETVLLELDSATSGIHNGGALHFGQDGKLYAAVGDHALSADAQSLDTRFGKMLRIDSDGAIPVDNPFFNQASGANRAIWALGLRNPFTFAFQPGSGRMFINDVGASAWEEVNDGIAGSNYGWPESEGPTSDPRFRAPLFAYTHGSGCAITGGAFYAPSTSQFPSEYEGQYFFSDFCSGWIRRLDPVTATTNDFAAGIAFPVDLKVGDDGSLYYLARGSGSGGSVWRVQFTDNQAPQITSHPASVTVSAGKPASFSVTASGAAPLSYRWQRDGTDIPGATSSSYALASTSLSDDGATFRAVVTNDLGSATSDWATLTVTANTPPNAVMWFPLHLQLYSAGETESFAGTGYDDEDGPLSAAAFTWQVDFHHEDHVHPFMPPTSGITSGQFTIPTTGETSANVWYRVILTVRDSGGLTATTYRDVVPRTVTLTLATSPMGLQLTLDGQPVLTPFSVQGVVGMQRTLGAPSPQAQGPATWDLESWSDGGAATHILTTPATDATYTAAFSMGAEAPAGQGLFGKYFDNPDFTGPAIMRLDPTVNFDWGGSSPVPGIGASTFSVRWQGIVRAKVSGVHTFSTVSGDGVRLFINGQLLIDNWTDHAPTESSGGVVLSAGQRYAIRMDVYENVGGAMAKLLWSAPGLDKEVVPQSHLHPFVLLVTDSTTLNPGDAAVKSRLESQGYVVWPRAAAASTTADAGLQALVLISSTVAASDVGTKFSSVVNPVLTWESQLLADLGMAGASEGTDYGTLGDQASLTLMVGPRTELTVTNGPGTFSWGQPNGNAAVIARSADDDARPLIFAYERGAAMVGRTAPGRRVSFFLEDDTAASLTLDGRALFDAVVRWASGR